MMVKLFQVRCLRVLISVHSATDQPEVEISPKVDGISYVLGPEILRTNSYLETACIAEKMFGSKVITTLSASFVSEDASLCISAINLLTALSKHGRLS